MKAYELEAELSHIAVYHMLLTLVHLQSALIKLAVEHFVMAIDYYPDVQHFSILYSSKRDTFKNSLARDQFWMT